MQLADSCSSMLDQNSCIICACICLPAQQADVSLKGAPAMQVFIPHRDDVAIDGIDVSKDFLSLQARQGGLQASSLPQKFCRVM